MLVANNFMEQEISDKVELTLKATSDDFVKTILSHLVTGGAILLPTKIPFSGQN